MKSRLKKRHQGGRRRVGSPALVFLFLTCAAWGQAIGAAPLYPAQPAEETIYWGAAVEGNGDPYQRHEVPAGISLSIRRTYFRWDQRDASYMKQIVADDHVHNRLPWISFKTPDWGDMAAGTYDAQIDQLLLNLRNAGKSIWLTIWHEPENDLTVGSAAEHLAMNRRVRERMTALNVKNVALAADLMAWTWNSASGRNPEQWWGPGIYDLLGIDIYQESEALLLTSNWYTVRAWAKQKGVDVAVGEWGMRGTNAAAGQRERDWYEDAVHSATDNRGARVVGLSAFDSGLNSPSGSWELAGEQLSVFHQLMSDPRTAHIPEPATITLLLMPLLRRYRATQA